MNPRRTTRRAVSGAGPILLLALCLAVFSACARENVVSQRGILEGLPGAQGGVTTGPEGQPKSEGFVAGTGAAVPPTKWESMLGSWKPPQAPKPEGLEGKEPLEPEPELVAPLRLRYPDGRLELISASPGHVMYHLSQTLENQELDLLLQQVLSERTKRAYASEGRSPMEAVQWLAARKKQLDALFATMPMGDQTPGMILQSLGNNAFRLSVSRASYPDLKLHDFDVVIEQGKFRLLRVQ